MVRALLAALTTSLLLTAQAPDLGRLRRDVYALAGPEFQGRATGEPGQRKAAAYIAARMKANGLRPLAGPGMGGETPYHFPYALTRTRFDVSGSHLTLGGIRLRLGEGFLCATSGSAEGEAVFLGYGIQAPELGWDDLRGVDLRGRWAVLLSGRPGGPFQDHPDHPATPDAAKAQAALQAGALGVVFLHDPEDPALRASEARLRRLLEEPRYALPERGTPPAPRGARVTLLPEGARALGLEVAALRAAQGEASTPRSLGRLELQVAAQVEPAGASNVVGFIPGSDPALKEEVVILSAHHDHLGMAKGRLHPGADDDASGTAGILETGRLLRKARPRRSVLILSVSGEEKGLWGSEVFTTRPPLPLARVVADLNLDMIGRGRPDELHVTPARIPGAVTTLTAEARRLAERQGWALGSGAEPYWRRSDHFNFAKQGIPALFFFAGMHGDYHQPSDTPDKIDFRKVARVVRLTRDLALAVANAPGRPQPVPAEVYQGWAWASTATAPEPTLKP